VRDRIATQQLILGDEAGEVTPAGADFLSKLASICQARAAKRRPFAARVWIGPNGDRISAAQSARAWRTGASN
jgi:hypothetical protein